MPHSTDAPVLNAPTPADSLRRPAAVLWDMDGTLINSEPYWMAAEHELAASHGLVWTDEQGLALVGNDLLTSAAVFVELGVPLTPMQIIDFLLERVIAHVEREVPWQTGALEALAWMRAAEVPCALVTMSYRSFADAFVARAPEGTFDVVISGDEVVQGKPHPEPYLTAAARLGVAIEDCLVVEDSPAGIASALASGAVPVGIQVMVDLPEDPRLNRLTTLADLTPAVVDQCMRGVVVDRLTPPV